MIDSFGLALSHGLIILAVWRLMRRPDLNDDKAPVPAPGEGSPWSRWKGRKGA